MNDPRVATLTYRVLESESLGFENPAEVEINTDDFTGGLSKGILTLRLKQHFATGSEVKPIADAFVQAWGIDAGLRDGRPDFRLRFGGSQIVERNPNPNVHSIRVPDHLDVSGSEQVKVIRPAYPDVPHGFVVTPEVEILWARFCRYVGNQEPLLGMAYACLTLLEKGNRKLAAKHYAIHNDVLRKLGELTSTRGDNATARKISDRTTPLSERERVRLFFCILSSVCYTRITPYGYKTQFVQG
jgi:hypothetical protein